MAILKLLDIFVELYKEPAFDNVKPVVYLLMIDDSRSTHLSPRKLPESYDESTSRSFAGLIRSVERSDNIPKTFRKFFPNDSPFTRLLPRKLPESYDESTSYSFADLVRSVGRSYDIPKTFRKLFPNVSLLTTHEFDVQIRR